MDENEVFENYYFIINKRLLKLLGIWPYQNRSLKIYLRTSAIVLIYTMMIPQVIRFYEEWYEEDRQIDIIAENFWGFIYFHTVLAKIVMSVFAEKKLQHLYEQITRDFKTIRDPDERAAIAELWSFSRLLTIAYGSYMFFSCFFFVFSPTVLPAIFDFFIPLNESRPKAICYYAEYFIDQDKYLYQLMLHTFVVVGITVLTFAAVDTSFVAVTYHVLGLFNLLTCRLKRLSEYANDQIHREEQQLYNFVRDTIRIHKRTLQLADLIRVNYNDINFFTTVMAVMGFSIGTIEVVANITNPPVIMRIGVVWVGLLIYLFFTNWPGQSFLDSSEAFDHAIYSCNWYMLPVRIQYLAKFMMMRCTIPCQLTAGPLLRLNFANVGVILRTAMSYFTAVTSLS